MRRVFRQLTGLVTGAIEQNLQYIEPRIPAFSLVAVLGFPIYYFVWHDLFPQPYENLTMRLIGSIIFFPLLFLKRWPIRLRQYLSFYWYFAILFGLPFFFTFMLLKNAGCLAWQLSTLTAIFIMVLVLDWKNILIQSSIGVTCALLAFYGLDESAHVGNITLESLPVFGFAVILGSIANYSFSRIQKERQQAMLSTASNIAHEMRTPLLGIKAGAAGLRKLLPALISGYQAARGAGLPVAIVREAHLDSMQGVLERIENEVDHSNVFIDMLLMNARLENVNFSRQTCSISDCLEKALQRYPFSSEKQRALVRWKRDGDFDFRGDELLMVHVFFNLLKNALFHIAKAGKGEIEIRIEQTPKGNKLRFRDTGTGIPPNVLPHVFTRFYSCSAEDNRGEGAGVGLAFCRGVMEGMGGTVEAESKLGMYTEFILTFPVAEAA